MADTDTTAAEAKDEAAEFQVDFPDLLRLTVVCVRNVFTDDGKPPSSMLVELGIAGGKTGTQRTRTVKKTGTFEYHQTFLFRVPKRKRLVNICVMSAPSMLSVTGKGSVLGMCELDLEQLCHPNDPHPTRVTAELRPKNSTSGAVYSSAVGGDAKKESDIMKRGASLTCKMHLLNSADQGRDFLANFEQGDTDSESDVEEEQDTEEPAHADNKEAEERKRAQAEALRQRLEKLESTKVLDGTYKLQVDVIEVRDLRLPDGNMGKLNPVAKVSAHGQTEYTSIRKGTSSCVFDALFDFELEDMTREKLEDGDIEISLYHASANKVVDAFGGRQLIGSFSCDFDHIYFTDQHEIFRQWVGLVNPNSNGECGIQGFLLVSLRIAGPMDKLPIHTAEENSADDGHETMILEAPSIAMTLNFLVVSLVRAEDLPPMDANFLTGAKGIDAYSKIEFGVNKPVKTAAVPGEATGHSRFRAVWRRQYWLPVMMPSLNKSIRITVWDKDEHMMVRHDEIVATAAMLKVPTEVQSDREAGLRWVNLYGAMSTITNNVGPDKATEVETMNKRPSKASHYRGRVLLGLRLDENNRVPKLPNQVFKKKLKSREVESVLPTEMMWTLRATVYAGAGLKEFMLDMDSFSVEVTIGLHSMACERRSISHGSIEFAGQDLQMEVSLPQDPTQIPDVIVYLLKGSARIAYLRFEANEVLNQDPFASMSSPQWYALQPDPVAGKYSPANSINQLAEQPGKLLMRLVMHPQNEPVPPATWPLHSYAQKRRVRVMVHLHQARHLPSMDDNGALDPYVVVSLSGVAKPLQSSTRAMSTAPIYYETLSFDDVLVPNDTSLLPELQLKVMDADRLLGGIPTGDDYVGELSVPLPEPIDVAIKDCPRVHIPPPTWAKLAVSERLLQEQFRSGTLGNRTPELLFSVSCFCVKEEANDFASNSKRPSCKMLQLEPPSIRPEFQAAKLEVFITGARGLKSPDIVPLRAPHIEFQLQQQKSTLTFESSKSKRPSPRNPNYLQSSSHDVELPVDPIFAPTLRFTVRDRLLGGLNNRIVGTGFLDLDKSICEAVGIQPARGMVKSDSEDSLFSETGDVARSARSSIGLSSPRASMDEELGGAEEEKERDPTAGLSSEDPRADDSSNMEVRRAKTVDMLASREQLYLGPPFKRREVGSGLEQGDIKLPFDEIPIFRGAVGGGQRQVGMIKGCFRVNFAAGVKRSDTAIARAKHEEQKMEQLIRGVTGVHSKFQVRLYVLSADSLTTESEIHADPYLRVSLGKQHRDTRSRARMASSNPAFHEYFEFTTAIPGDTALKVQVVDYDRVGGDDLIGETTIDLEDRWFSSEWQDYGVDFARFMRKKGRSVAPRKPIEHRSLTLPTSLTSRGNIRLWVDILSAPDAKTIPPDDISLPPEEEWEIRLIIYKTKNILPDPEETMSDMFVTARMSKTELVQSTDTHWRVNNGTGSFNWRMKFPITLPHPKPYAGWGRVFLTVMDYDLLSENDVLWEVELDIAADLNKAFSQHGSYQVFRNSSDAWVTTRDEVKQHCDVGEDDEYLPSSTKQWLKRNQKLFKDGRLEPWQEDMLADIPLDWFGPDFQFETKKKHRRPLGALIRKARKGTIKLGGDGDPGCWCCRRTSGSEKKSTEMTPLMTNAPASLTQMHGGDNLKSKNQKPKKTRSAPPKGASRAFADGFKQMLGVGPDPENSQWIMAKNKLNQSNAKHKHGDGKCCCNFCGGHPGEDDEEMQQGETAPKGGVLIGIEVLPKKDALHAPAGLGRAEPNMNPMLPPPVGRPDPMKMWNPCYVISTFCGTALAIELCCCFCVLVFLVLTFTTGPVFLNLVTMVFTLPYYLGWWISALVISPVLFGLWYTQRKCSEMCCNKPLPGDDAEETHVDG